MSIPFEALDVYLQRPFDLELNRLYDKVVYKNRGGYCYELNTLFHTFLNAIGFDNYIISARIFDSEKYGPEFDHMAIIVNLGEQYLVDVGYGDLILQPILLHNEDVQEDRFKSYKIKSLGNDTFTLSQSLKGKNDFAVKYSFTNIPRSIHDFEEQNQWKQQSPDSHFVKNRICTLPTSDGRKTIMNNTYKVRSGNHVTEKEIVSDTELIHILVQDFGIQIQTS